MIQPPFFDLCGTEVEKILRHHLAMRRVVSHTPFHNSVEQHDSKGRTALQVAGLNARYECMEHLIERGANIVGLSANGKSVLHLACSKKDEIIARKLVVEKLLKIEPWLFNIPTKSTSKDVPSLYPLHVAIFYDNLHILDLLIKYCTYMFPLLIVTPPK